MLNGVDSTEEVKQTKEGVKIITSNSLKHTTNTRNVLLLSCRSPCGSLGRLCPPHPRLSSFLSSISILGQYFVLRLIIICRSSSHPSPSTVSASCCLADTATNDDRLEFSAAITAFSSVPARPIRTVFLFFKRCNMFFFFAPAPLLLRMYERFGMERNQSMSGIRGCVQCG